MNKMEHKLYNIEFVICFIFYIYYGKQKVSELCGEYYNFKIKEINITILTPKQKFGKMLTKGDGRIW